MARKNHPRNIRSIIWPSSVFSVYGGNLRGQKLWAQQLVSLNPKTGAFCLVRMKTGKGGKASGKKSWKIPAKA